MLRRSSWKQRRLFENTERNGHIQPTGKQCSHPTNLNTVATDHLGRRVAFVYALVGLVTSACLDKNNLESTSNETGINERERLSGAIVHFYRGSQ